MTVAAVAAWRWFPFARGTGRPVLGRVNLLLVTIDTLRADRVGGELTPAINTLARRGTLFTEARSVVPLTLPAHASLMTGLLPPNHGVRLNGLHRLSPDTPTLARLLRSAGYRTAAVIGAYVLDRRFGLGEGFETYDDDIARGDQEAGLLEAERRGDVVADRAIAWLEGQPTDGRPFYLWVHLYDPHAPYAPPLAWLERAHGQPYDGEIAYADAQLGRIVDALAARRLSDHTLIVVAGDHGESLGDHGEQTHGWLVYEKAIDVPLVFSAAGLVASPRTDVASLVDVVPTVLGLLGLPAPSGLDGRDLFAPGAVRADADAYAETQYPQAAGCSPLYALVSGRWKYIGGPAAPELYDLAVDPAEQHNVAGAHRSVADAMGSRVAAIGSRGVASVPTALSRDAVERLRALGYVAATPTAAPPAGAAAPSPASRVRDWERFQQALADLAAGRRERALTALADLVRQNPDASLFHGNYARALDESGKPRDAVDAYRRALLRWPENTTLLHGYAIAARDAGMRDIAMKAEEAVLALDPTDAAAHNGIGLLHADVNDPARARAAFERTVELDPHVVSYWVNLGNARRATQDAPGAERAYREALRLDPASPDALNGVGVVLVQGGRGAEAVSWFERALASAPRFYEAWLNLGIACQESGSVVRAREAYRQVLAIAPAGTGERAAASRLLASLAGRE